MTYLKAAVDKQRSFLIAKLIQAGIIDPADSRVYSLSIAELSSEYERSILNKKENII